MEPNRFSRPAPPADYKTYRIAAPLDTHFEEVPCSVFECEAYREGFLIAIDEVNGSTSDRQRAKYIRDGAGGRRYLARPAPEVRRRYAHLPELAGLSDNLTVFLFPPGQECFEPHYRRIEREEIFLVHRGDHRGFIGDPRRHSRPADWVEDFAEHQDRLSRAIKRG